MSKKYFNFSTEEINFIKKIFFNAQDLFNINIKLITLITKENKKCVNLIPEIRIYWKNKFSIYNYLILSFKENSQFKFEAKFNAEEVFIYSSEFDLKANSESEYNLKCLNYFEDCLNNIGVKEFNAVELMSFIFK